MVSYKEKIVDDEANIRGRWSDIAFVNILDLYEEEWRHFDKSCLSFKHWTHIRTKHHCQLLDECHQKEEQIKKKIEKMKSKYRHQKTLLEEQTKGSGSTWSWFRRMTIIMECFGKGDGALGGVDQGTMEIIEKVDHEIPNI